MLAVSGMGFAKVFMLEDSKWVQLGDTLQSDEDERFGKATALSADGDFLAMAGTHQGSFSQQTVCCVNVFGFMDNNWASIQQISGLEEGNGFGESVDLSADGLSLVAGAPGSNDNGHTAGHIHMFNAACESLVAFLGKGATEVKGLNICIEVDLKRTNYFAFARHAPTLSTLAIVE